MRINTSQRGFHDGLVELFRLSFLQGEEPFAREHSFGRPLRISELVPDNAVVERECLESNVHSLLVRGHGWSGMLVAPGHEGPARFEVTAASSELADEMMCRLVAAAPDAKRVDDVARVSFWSMSDSFPESFTRELAVPAWAVMASNYPPPVAERLAQIVARPRLAASGRLMVLHGPTGTGKTSFIRSLAREWRDDCDVHYIVDPGAFLSKPTYLLHVLSDAEADRPRLVVAEDVDAFLRNDRFGLLDERIARLLNIADGLPGQGQPFLLLFTTNIPPEQLHPALLRPGRCAARLELRAFTPREATQFLGRPHSTYATLVELLEARGDLTQITDADQNVVSTGQYL